MRRSHFWPGVGFAAAAAVVGALFAAGIAPLIGTSATARLIIPLLGLAYVFFLLSRAGSGVGRLSTFAVWVSVAAASWFWVDSPMLYLLLHVAMLWLIRALYFHSSVLAALGDGGLFAVGVICSAGTLLKTESTMLGIWVFFLIQALFSSLPNVRSREASRDSEPHERFADAQGRAEGALAHLIARSRIH